LEELKKGAKINITVKGFASPLAKTDYNVNLTKRRISSLVNYLMHYDNGVFKPYLTNTAPNGGKVIFTQVPFGEYTANKLTSDNFHDQKNSVYSRSAAIERKIEIQSVDYLTEDSLAFITSVSPRFIDLQAIKQGASFSKTITISNKSNEVLTLKENSVDNAYLTITCPTSIPANSSIQVTYTSNKPLPAGLFSFGSQLYFENYPNPMIIMINGEGF
jgi:hypothetical protein